MLKKFLSIALSCGMVLTLLPTCVFAGGSLGTTTEIGYSSEKRAVSFWGEAEGLLYDLDGEPVSDTEKEQYTEPLRQSYINFNFDTDILRVEKGNTGRNYFGKDTVSYTVVVPDGTTVSMSKGSKDIDIESFRKSMWSVTDTTEKEEYSTSAQFPDIATLNANTPELIYTIQFSEIVGVYVDASIKICIENDEMEFDDDHEPIRLGTRDDAIVLKIDSVETRVFGEKVTKDAAPVIRNGRTMLPIRFVVEALGGTVGWDETQQEVAIKLNTTEIGVGIGSKTAQVGDKEVNLDSPAYVENGRTYLPLRFVAENLGAEVLWDNETREVIIIPDK